MGIFDKRERCEYCKEGMVSKYRNKRFCSAKCRVYWNRENKKGTQNKTSSMPLPPPESKISLRERLNSLG